MNMALFPDVVVNHETIPSAAIAAEAQNHSAPKDKPGIAWRKAAPEFEAALRTLEEGKITPTPVLSRHGWHIIRLNATAPGQVLPYETVRPKIAQALEKAAWARASRDFIETLAKGAQITGASLAPI
jgi:parvulin-like peptidyl-prolyl isomerase